MGLDSFLGVEVNRISPMGNCKGNAFLSIILQYISPFSYEAVIS